MVLATDAQGRLAVGLLFEEQPGQAAVQLRLGYADAAGAFGRGGSGGSSSSFFLDARLGSREAAADELRRRGFTPLAQPSWAQLEAAVPLALWEGEHVRRCICWGASRVYLSECVVVPCSLLCQMQPDGRCWCRQTGMDGSGFPTLDALGVASRCCCCCCCCVCSPGPPPNPLHPTPLPSPLLSGLGCLPDCLGQGPPLLLQGCALPAA